MSEADLLDVYMHGSIAGTLERRSQAKLRFTYGERWAAEEGLPLSLSLPVRSEPYEHDECAPFFEGLLPEGDFLKAIARTLHVSASNPFQLLTELGGECAGAISVGPAGGPEPGRDPRPPRWLSEEELATLLGDLPRRSLLAALDEEDDGFRLSLAGAQNKLGVLTDGDRIGLSHGKPPTTDILKAPIPHVSESVANEAFCMSLAAHVDLETAPAFPRLAHAEEYLLVHRFDRGGDAPDGRIHQEDFCQALGLVPTVKYEKEGGPKVADCAELVRRHCSAPARDILVLLDALILNFLIANHDAHSKNYSLLLDGPGSIRIAPLYDLISTVAFEGSDRKLAMKYGGENRPAYLRGRHLDRLAGDLGVKPALVRRRALAMCERINAAAEAARNTLPDEFQDCPILDRIAKALAERTETLAKRAKEQQESAEGLPGVGEEDFGEAADVVVQRFSELSEALDGMGAWLELVQSLPDRDPDELEQGEVDKLAAELGGPARQIKVRGRSLYDGVVDMDSAIRQDFGQAEDEEEPGPSSIKLLEAVSRIAANSHTALTKWRAVYEGILNLPGLSTDFREPIRDMRAGVHDVMDAQEIMIDWGERAKALMSAQAPSGED